MKILPKILLCQFKKEATIALANANILIASFFVLIGIGNIKTP